MKRYFPYVLLFSWFSLDPSQMTESYKNNYPHYEPDALDMTKWLLWDRFFSDTPVMPSPNPNDIPQPVYVDLEKIKKPLRNQATWLGHATYLIQIDGVNILTDPMLSERASPVSFAGPKRLQSSGLSVETLPSIDMVILSHNHYDHFDIPTITRLGNKPQYFIGKGNKKLLSDSVENAHIFEFQWWNEKSITINNINIRITSVPVQHFSGRGVFDRNKSLWTGWVIEIKKDLSVIKLFFSGDTGFSDDFKDIHYRLGNIDYSFLPIGAYEPQTIMKPVHINPEEAVKIHKILHVKQSFAMHWGTFVLTDEPIDEPPKRLKQALQNEGLSFDEFKVLQIGETVEL